MALAHPESHQPKSMRRQALFNRVVKGILHSSLHRLVSKHLMLLTYRGRKTGLTRTVPLTYLQQGGAVYAFCDQNVTWWKNLRNPTPVTLVLRGHTRTGTATATSNNPDAILPTYGAFLLSNRQAGGFHAVSFDGHGRPDALELERSARTTVMIRIALDDTCED